MELGLFLFKLFYLGLHLSHQHNIVHLCVFLYFLSQQFKLICQFLLLSNHIIVILRQFFELILQSKDLLFKSRELTFVILQTHLVLIELSQQRLQTIFFHSQKSERLFHLLVCISQLAYSFLIFLTIFINLFDLSFMLFNQFQVISSNVVVVILELGKCLFVVLHQLVNVQIFSFLQLMNFDSRPQLQLILHFIQLVRILLLKISKNIIMFIYNILFLRLVILLEYISRLNILLLVIDLLFFQVVFIFLHLFHSVLKIFVLFSFSPITVLFNIDVGFLLLIFQQFQFLNEDLDFSIMIYRHFLPVCFFIQDSCMCLVDLQFGIVVKLLYHVSIHLNIVPLGLYFVDSFFIQAEIILEFRGNHFHEFIIGLLLLLWLFRRHKLQLFLCEYILQIMFPSLNESALAKYQLINTQLKFLISSNNFYLSYSFLNFLIQFTRFEIYLIAMNQPLNPRADQAQFEIKKPELSTLTYKRMAEQGQCILLAIQPIQFLTSRFALYILINIILVGIPWLICQWFPDFIRHIYFTSCQLQKCTHFYVKNYDDTYTIVQKHRSVFYTTEQDGFQCFHFVNRYLKYIIKDQIVQAGVFNEKDRIKRIIQNNNQQSGLSEQQAQRLIQTYGPGAMVVSKPPMWQLFRTQIFKPLYLFLICSCILWYFFQTYYFYATVILVTSTLVMITTLIQINDLNSKIFNMAYYQTTVNVLREGNIISKSSLQITPGDIVFLKQQKKLPFDGVILEGGALMDESALTGQSVPVLKKSIQFRQFCKTQNIDKNSIVIQGTNLLQVDTRGVQKFEKFKKQFGIPVCVTKTNFVTTKGHLIRLISFPRQRINRFQRQSFKFLGFLSCLSISTYLLLVIKLHQTFTVADMIIKCLDLITITVPPGIFIAMTSGIYYSLEKLKAHEIYCIQANKVIDGGDVDLICFDKTGTLTHQHMDFFKLIPVNEHQFDNPISSFEEININKKGEHIQSIIYNMAANHTVVRLESDGKLTGDPMEIAVLQFSNYELDDTQQDNKILYALKSKVDGDKISVLKRFQFDSTLQRMSVIIQTNLLKGNVQCLVKGSPQMIFKLLKKSSAPHDYNKVLKQYTSRGFRVLAVASKKIPLTNQQSITKYRNTSRQEVESELTLDGFQIFQNKLKEQTYPAIKQLRQCLIDSVIITGDNPLTGSNIAYKCEIIPRNCKMMIFDYDQGIVKTEQFRNEQQLVSGNTIISNQIEMQQLDLPLFHQLDAKDQQLHKQLKKAQIGYKFCITGSFLRHFFSQQPQKMSEISKKFFKQILVFARAKPLDKSKVIQIYQSLGKITAMCGDGANDCGALKQADVGLSLSSTEASISAPFTSKVPNISSMIILLKQCRAGLVTNFSLFNIMAIYSLIQYTTSVIAQFFYCYPSDFQFIYYDIFGNFFFFLLVAKIGSCDKLTKQRPNSTLFSFSNLTYIVIMALIQLAGQILIILSLSEFFANDIDYFKHGWFEVNKERYLIAQKSLTDCPQTSALFLFSNYLYLFTVIALTVSKPWKQQFYTNFLFMLTFVFVMSTSIILNLVPSVRFDFMQIVYIDSEKLNIFILIAGLSFGVFIYLNQKFILEPLMNWVRTRFPQKKWI